MSSSSSSSSSASSVPIKQKRKMQEAEEEKKRTINGYTFKDEKEIKEGQSKEIEDWENEYDEKKRMRMILNSIVDRPGGVYFNVHIDLSPKEDFEGEEVYISQNGESRRYYTKMKFLSSYIESQTDSEFHGIVNCRVENGWVETYTYGHYSLDYMGIVPFEWKPMERWDNYASHKKKNKWEYSECRFFKNVGPEWTKRQHQYVDPTTREREFHDDGEEEDGSDGPENCIIDISLEWDRLWIGPELRKLLLYENWIPINDLVQLCISYLPCSLIRYADELSFSRQKKKQKK